MRWLLDMNVISELVAKSPNSQAVDWEASVHEQPPSLGLTTIGEIKRGAEKPAAATRKQRLPVWLEGDLLGGGSTTGWFRSMWRSR